jgi:hypothetical protein
MNNNKKYPLHKTFTKDGITIGMLIDYEDHTIQFLDRLSKIRELMENLQVDMWKYDKTQLRNDEIESFDELKKIIDKYNSIINKGSFIGNDFLGNRNDNKKSLMSLKELSDMLNETVKLKNTLIEDGFTFNSDGYAERTHLDKLISFYNTTITKDNNDDIKREYESIETTFNCYNIILKNVQSVFNYTQK